jgi:DinB family protein
MHPHVADVFARLDAARAALRAAVDAVPPPLRVQRPAPDRWSVNEVLEHLSLVEGLFAKRLADAIAAAHDTVLPPETTPRTPLPAWIETLLADRGNGRTAPPPAQPRGSLDDAAAWAAVTGSRAVMREAIAAGDGFALSSVTVDHPFFGTLSVYEWGELIAGHEVRHTAQIHEIAAQLAAL